MPVIILLASTDKVAASTTANKLWVTWRTIWLTASLRYPKESLGTITAKCCSCKPDHFKALVWFLWNFFDETITERHDKRAIGQFIMDPVFCFAQRC